MGKLGSSYMDFIPDPGSWIRKSFFDKLQIAPWNLKISAETCIVIGILESLLKFVRQIFWTESVYDLIGHNRTVQPDSLSYMQE